MTNGRLPETEAVSNMDCDLEATELRVLTGDSQRSHREASQLQRRIVNYLLQRVPALDQIRVEVYHGTAVLSGTVSSQSIRWRCLDCCRHVAGVVNVIDRLVVLPDHESEDLRQQQIVTPSEKIRR